MPEPPLDPIPGHGISNLLRHNKTHPDSSRWIGGVRVHMHDDAATASPDPTFDGRPEIIGAPKASPGGQHDVSAGQFDATLASTCAQDSAASAGSHTGTETVRAAATAVTRLEGAFAHLIVSSGSSKGRMGLGHQARHLAAAHEQRLNNNTQLNP